MSVQSHVIELKRKHAELSAEVETLETAPSVNQMDLSKLKREKLRLKDQIEEFSRP